MKLLKSNLIPFTYYGHEFMLTWRCGGEEDGLMQYTGLKDSNDVEVYEGDIISLSKKPCDPNHIVFYSDIDFGFAVKDADGYQTPFNWYTGGYIVIGNIYENPELIEEK